MKLHRRTIFLTLACLLLSGTAAEATEEYLSCAEDDDCQRDKIEAKYAEWEAEQLKKATPKEERQPQSASSTTETDQQK